MIQDLQEFSFYKNQLKKSVVFKEVPDKDLETILADCYVETWSKESIPFRKEKTLHTFYFVVSGRIKMYRHHPYNGNEFILYLNSSGDVFDVICLLDGKTHTIEMEPLDEVVLLATPIENARNWIATYPSFNKMLLPYLADKLRKMEEKANDLALLDTWTRTLKLFIKHTKVNLKHSELKLINNLSHSEIAKIIGTSKNVVNRHIQRLKNDNILHVDRKHIEIKNFNKLLDKLKEHHFSL